jgi:two-component system, cell cycle sensor histidine kinase and response regulator CckA
VNDDVYQPLTAVVVNDDPTQLWILSGLVRKAGLEPLAFAGAEAALDAMAGARPPDLIITDLYMPDLDGWRLCRLLRSSQYADLNSVPILVVSATFAGGEANRIAADLGVEGFLPCPVDGHLFCEEVAAILHGEREPSHPRVLIVEDCRTQAKLLKNAFSAEGYEVNTAVTIQAAVECFSRVTYNVAVVDYHLPDGLGDGLLDRFRAAQPDCVFLMMTTDPGPELALTWMKRGAAAYLHKPFDAPYLIELCARARRERALLRVQDILEVRSRELREANARHTAMLANIGDVIGIMSPSGILTYKSANIERWFGWTPEELVDTHGFGMVHQEDLERVQQEFDTLIEKANASTTVVTPVCQVICISRFKIT